MNTLKRTKIVCTMGPAVASQEKILALIDAGMNVARLNFSHGTHEEHARTIALLKQARSLRKVPLAIMVDTKGPEVRLGRIQNEQFAVKARQQIPLVKQELLGTSQAVQITPASVVDALQIGMRLLMDDGYLIAHVVEKRADAVVIELENDGFVKSQKSAHVPGVNLDLPVLTEQDVRDIAFACAQGVDLIAASFVHSGAHVRQIQQLLTDNHCPDILVIAKIESHFGVQNFDEILEAADGIMVARGDLGVELPLTHVPALQKEMIRKCCHVGKPVITATQMLESMIHNPRPTRAEVSDVANALYDSTTAVMLSGETAVGEYPIETVQMMQSIIEETEKQLSLRAFFDKEAQGDYRDISHSVALASVKTAYSAGAKAIFCFTSSGRTARLVAQFRPEIPIVTVTPHERTYHQLALYWGVVALPPTEAKEVQDAFRAASRLACEQGVVKKGDLVVITSGAPFGVSGSTNMMLVETV